MFSRSLSLRTISPVPPIPGVNVTIGLPIVRTSVDHGTAFDKAGEGRANPQSMIEAIKLAARLSR